MTGTQILSFSLIGGAVVIFASGRFRYDVVALVALAIGIATGDVPMKEAFSGFTSDVVVIIACALVVSAAIARSGVIEWAVGGSMDRLRGAVVPVPVMAGTTALLSMLTKNVGALAIMMPIALRIGRNEGSSTASLLMPMSFMSLLGGLVTLVGTSTNIIVSQIREETLGRPFHLFDFAPAGLILTVMGFVFVCFGWRLLPRERQARKGLDDAAEQAPYVTEARLPDELPTGLATIADLKLSDAGVTLRAIVQGDGRQLTPLPDASLHPGASLVLEGSDKALDRLFARTPLEQVRDLRELEKDDVKEELRTIEAVIQPGSLLIGRSAADARLQHIHGVQLIGIGRSRERITQRLREVTLRAGDVLILRAGEKTLPEALADLGLLPLVERMVKLGDRRRMFLPMIILLVAMGLVALELVPIAAAFFSAAVLMVVVGGLSMREAYAALEPEVLVLIGALTPLSEAIQHSGGSQLIAGSLAGWLSGVSALLALGAVMAAAMACSPFLHNAPTVLVLAPIAVDVARGLHLHPDPFLMAVATGAGCDFLTPIGHQCNTLVMGPGGYRFGDFWRLGLPLSALVILIGTMAIAFIWPLA